MYCEKQEFYGHTNASVGEKGWQPLKEHIQNVSNLIKTFAEKLKTIDWGYIAGLWHDFGRDPAEFKKRTSAVDECKSHIEVIGRVKCLTVGAEHAN